MQGGFLYAKNCIFTSIIYHFQRRDLICHAHNDINAAIAETKATNSTGVAMTPALDILYTLNFNDPPQASDEFPSQGKLHSPSASFFEIPAICCEHQHSLGKVSIPHVCFSVSHSHAFCCR